MLSYPPSYMQASYFTSYMQRMKTLVFSSPGLLKEQRRKHDTKAAVNLNKQILNESIRVHGHSDQLKSFCMSAGRLDSQGMLSSLWPNH